MELITSWERKARAEGRTEGLAEGLRNGIDALLLTRFGNAGLVLRREIETITKPMLLKAILTRLTTAVTLDEVRDEVRALYAAYADI